MRGWGRVELQGHVRSCRDGNVITWTGACVSSSSNGENEQW